MKQIETLYQKLAKTDSWDFYLSESEFCQELYYHIAADKRPPCATAFLTVVNWFAMSQRSGVWTFYEAASPQEIQLTLEFLEQRGDGELAAMLRYGAHDYQNPKYAGNWNYPDSWIEESQTIDRWIADHEDWLYRWEQTLLADHKDLLCSLAD